MQSVHFRMNLSLSPPPKKNPGSAYATVHKKKLSTAIFILCMDMIWFKNFNKNIILPSFFKENVIYPVWTWFLWF